MTSDQKKRHPPVRARCTLRPCAPPLATCVTAAHHFSGWDTGGYQLTIAEPGTVVLNGNDC